MKNKINSIEIVDHNDHTIKIIINNNYLEYHNYFGNTKIRRALISLAHGGPIKKSTSMGEFNFLNSINSPIVKQMGYKKQRILEEDGTKILPNVIMKMLSKGAFLKRYDKQRKLNKV